MIELLSDPAAWAALSALLIMEIVLGIDNLIFISIVTASLPAERQESARKLGIGLALVLRLLLLGALTWVVGLTTPVFDLGITGDVGPHGIPAFETAFSWRDIILVVGGVFLVWKATVEIHHRMVPESLEVSASGAGVSSGFSKVIAQIVALDVVFSIDSILTAVGMTTQLPIMVVAVIVAVLVMFVAANPMARFVNTHPTVVMLALAFLLSIGMILIADGFGRHIPKGYIYAAIGFASFVECLNILSRRRHLVK